jgi:hypothetical protein
MIADMVVDAEAGRLLYLRAAHLKNKGVRNTRETSLAKLFCGEAANRAGHNAVQIFGGYGFSDEYPVERFFRDAKVLNIYEGTREIQRMIIAQDALGIRLANGAAARKQCSPAPAFNWDDRHPCVPNGFAVLRGRRLPRIQNKDSQRFKSLAEAGPFAFEEHISSYLAAFSTGDRTVSQST